jgi:tetratricopeptide (TPR) repeat protein
MSAGLLRVMAGLLAAGVMVPGAPAAEGPAPPKPAWQRLLQGDEERKAGKLTARLEALRQASQFAEALEVAAALARLRQERQGKDHWQAMDAHFDAEALRRVLRGTKDDQREYAASLLRRSQAESLVQKGRYREAEEDFLKALDTCRKVLGEDHPDTATSWTNLAYVLSVQGRYKETEEIYRKALAMRRKALGEAHPATALSCSNVAFNLNDQGRYPEAEKFSREALEICLEVLGTEHPYTALSYNNLAANVANQGRYREAEQFARQALAIRRRTLGEEHAETAQSYNNIASNLSLQRRCKEAEEGYRQALDIWRKVLGEEHPHTAVGYNNVAFNLEAQGRYQEAEQGFRKALDIRRKVLGEEHPETAGGYASLANNLNAQGRHKEAEEAIRKALEIQRKALGEEHPDTARSWNNLAFILDAQGRWKEAEEGFRKTLAIQCRVLGEAHPDTAFAHNNLAGNLAAQGKHKEAEESYQKALAIRRQALGEEHADTAVSYRTAATNLNDQGRYQEAEALYVRGADVFLTARMQFAASGLRRAAETSQRSPLLRLAALLARNGKPAAAWQRLEQSLGRGAWDDLSARLRRPARELARQTDLLAQLERVDQLLARQGAVADPTPDQKRERAELLDRRRKAHQELTRFQHHLEEAYGPVQGKVFGRQQIQAALPAAAALVAWIDIPATPGAADPNGEHWGVVLRAQGEPQFERLSGSGPGGAWTEEDNTLPQRLGAALQSPRGEWRELARRWRKQRLQPLHKCLEGSDTRPAVRHLVVLPSTATRGVPLEVVAEGMTVSYASSGTLYAHLRRQPAVKSRGLLALGDPIFEAIAPKERPLPPRGVLLTLVQPGSNAAQARLQAGDVLLKYGARDLEVLGDLTAAIAAVGTRADVPVEVWREGQVLQREVHPGKLGVVLARDSAPKALAERYRLDRTLSSRRGDDGWAQLPGTRVEVDSLRRLFGDKADLKILFDSDASEQKLDELAQSGTLGQYRYLHLATHGEVDDAWPLRSALILSRDKLPDAGAQLLADKPVYDGRLTAEEMLRGWNLESDLVTLSACQTALGKYEKGEGFVGFAQALLLCGSRSVCLSLWKVDDAATALLMHRFYANLLGKRDGLKTPLPKAEALQEAKQWLRTLPRAEALQVAAEVTQGVERGKGRPKGKLLPPVPEPMPAAKEDCPYAHPYYWAAFVLIGAPD